MNEVVKATAIENIADGPVECQIVVTGDGFAVVGQGTVEKLQKGVKRRGKYRKVDDLMFRAALALTTYKFTALELMRLLHLPRRSAYSLVKKAKAEIERQMAASEKRRREQEKQAEMEGERLEQDRVERDDGSPSVATLREGWERPSRDIRRFRS